MVDRVDVAVVGGGLAGLTATVALAEAGVGVRLYDHGAFEGRPGGGVVPGTTLLPLGGPTVRREVPYDRSVGTRRWLFLTADGDVGLDFLDVPVPLPIDGGMRTLRTSTLAPWLADRARTLGADLRPRATVEGLRRDARGRVAGVIADGAETEAKVTIIADGGGLRPVPTPYPEPPNVAVAEAVWGLSEKTVADRFPSRPGAIAVTEILLGGLSPEGPAGGYLIPFRTGVSIGVVAPLRPNDPGHDTELLGRLEAHPSIQPLLRGGSRGPVTRIEVSDRPELGRPLSGAGFLSVGTAAGLMAAGGTRFRATDASIRSGQLAAEVARDAVASGEASSLRLRSYRLHLEAHGLLDELRKVRASGRRYRSAPGVARDLPRFLTAVLHELMTESGGPKRRIVTSVREVRRRERVSRRTLLRSALVASRWA